jgi:natural product precursor
MKNETLDLQRFENVLSREQMKRIKGGEGGCCISSKGNSFCDNSTSLVAAWGDIWSSFGYDVYCDFGVGDPVA